MKTDIHKLADYLVKVSREGIAEEKMLVEWKETEERRLDHTLVAMPAAKAS